MRGSGISPKYGGGKFYGGGAAVPYTAGRRSPLGILPFLLPVVVIAAYFPGYWAYGAWGYPYSHPYYWRNRTATEERFDDRRRSITSRQAQQNNSNNAVQVLPVLCLCQQFLVCGCDDNQSDEFLRSILPNDTSDAQVDQTLLRISNVNGTRTIVINGTIANGTTAPGATDTQRSSASFGRVVLESSGWWLLVFIVGWTVWSV